MQSNARKLRAFVMTQECDSSKIKTENEGINLETLWANARRIERSHKNQVTLEWVR